MVLVQVIAYTLFDIELLSEEMMTCMFFFTSNIRCTLQWTLNQNRKISFVKNAFGNAACKISQYFYFCRGQLSLINNNDIDMWNSPLQPIVWVSGDKLHLRHSVIWYPCTHYHVRDIISEIYRITMIWQGSCYNGWYCGSYFDYKPLQMGCNFKLFTTFN